MKSASDMTKPPGGEGIEEDLPALLHAAGMGDERAWRRLIDLYARRVYAWRGAAWG